MIEAESNAVPADRGVARDRSSLAHQSRIGLLLMKTRHLAHEVVQVVAPGDIHDIRVLTATGPIDIPPAVTPEPERRKG